MSPEAIKFLAISIIMGVGTLGPAIAIGLIGSRGADSIGRNPEAAPKVQTAMILAIVFAEAIAIYALVVALILKFVA
jgi:F-type H+-transporting ATPase subunit c